MKLSRSNNTDRGGVATGTQPRQNPSQEAATLSFDLEFDTAEQGSTSQRVDVRDWTAVVRQFVEPPPDRPTDPPPAVRFAWGTLVFDGIIKQVTEELDLFAPDGTPLRAKVSVSITEQNFKYETLAQGAAAKTTAGATRPGQQDTGRGQPDRGGARGERLRQAGPGGAGAGRRERPAVDGPAGAGPRGLAGRDDRPAPAARAGRRDAGTARG